MNAQYTDLGPLPNPPISPLKKTYYFVYLLTLHYIARLIYHVRARFSPASTRPTLTKTYPANPHLTHRIFYPRSYRPGYDNLPLLLDIHGGGFALLTPSYDDANNAAQANALNIIIISLDYSKSPLSTFPTPLRELTATVSSILDDISLSYDRSRVIIQGYSAGGNLALCVAQSPKLRRKINGVCAWYPITDFSTPVEEKCRRRPYKQSTDVDTLSSMLPIFNAGYVPLDQDLRDPVLSPAFVTKREDLPEWMCWVGAEYDCLCQEAGAMAARMAGVTDFEREKYGFERNGGREKWMMVRNAEHDFTHAGLSEGVEVGKARKVMADVAYREVGEWLLRGPFAEKKR